MKLRKAQQKILLTWIAEGLKTDEINIRASKFRPRFKVSHQQVDYYRKSRDLQLEQIKEADDSDALKTGLALREERVKALKRLADTLLSELTRNDDQRLWTRNAKSIGQERYEYLEFNKTELDAFRGLLDDIASELGDRLKKIDVTSGGEQIQSLPPEQIAQRVAALMELAKKRKENESD